MDDEETGTRRKKKKKQNEVGLLYNLSFSKEDIIMKSVDEVVSDGRKSVTVNKGEKVVNVGIEDDVKLKEATKFEWIFFRSPFEQERGGTF